MKQYSASFKKSALLDLEKINRGESIKVKGTDLEITSVRGLCLALGGLSSQTLYKWKKLKEARDTFIKKELDKETTRTKRATDLGEIDLRKEEPKKDYSNAIDYSWDQDYIKRKSEELDFDVNARRGGGDVYIEPKETLVLDPLGFDYIKPMVSGKLMNLSLDNIPRELIRRILAVKGVDYRYCMNLGKLIGLVNPTKMDYALLQLKIGLEFIKRSGLVDFNKIYAKINGDKK